MATQSSETIGLWGAVNAFDTRISNAIYRAGRAVPRPVWKLYEYSGDGILWLTLTLAGLMAPSTPPAARRLWANLLAGLLLDLVLVGAIKATARRERPVYNAVAKDMVVVVAVDHFSFPSGHSSRVSFLAGFAAAAAAAQAPGVAVAATIWALSLALSRCAMGRHYLGDVLAGLLLGVVTVAAVTRGQFDEDGLVVSTEWADAAHNRAASWAPVLRRPPTPL